MGIGDLLGNSGGGSNKLIVWALVLIVIFGFGKGKKFGNFNFQNQSNFAQKSSKGKYASAHNKKKHVTSEAFNSNQFFNFGKNKGFGKMLGGNALFIVVIVAVIFFCKEKEEKFRETSTD
ncbi:hypothetical protein CPAST_c29080 [Clostridium pasteurianum DSM 525 = ATCC 6013]|uniref:Uncharacterized protein n=1 Tax=Clostridium pasteurianum DSM 525 = ATCC 6013 TaxID=1262449 RepID=A0A0H3J685_CLOPA|nr:hypothetical protein [Clostridium pasteurianum]AJA48974.1 hypothetical protein CPAST_c29080 [Clostridium pasteurianum DSM 525 = ATCC 6013]AJA52962.1 hypothetical protein CLPA_c29080 [Clostridium pasteurianum DSM 525 = ATCC 6013]AOZ76181.1 hypothetical protein AQ983_14135 [Clostridium pasteurianum DSM 525 = ATCC 6013]AOZ79977.1 hypothetical protein AQ984_14130 [Clostridium pasteurianum]ELP60270.1 hypothetical protein F502_06522 [Clostridium pasteurianum DSM 525 = ATCC 6013]